MKSFNDCCSPMEQDLIMRQKTLAMLREMDDFKTYITKLCENYIKMIDTKISTQDLKITNLYNSMEETVSNIIVKLIEEDKIKINVEYDEETESLYIGGVLIE